MEYVKYKGKLFDVVNRELTRTIITSGGSVQKTVNYELVRRGPGIRAIIVKDGRILLNKEFRYELGRWDYRLPGGKVFDNIDCYESALSTPNIQKHILQKLSEELREEADIDVINAHYIDTLNCGFTVEWDLIYFIVDEFDVLPSYYNNNTQKTEYEFIEHCWFSLKDVLELCINGQLSEARSAYMLMRYIIPSFTSQRVSAYDM